MFNSLTSSFINFHRNIAKPFFQKTLKNFPCLTTLNAYDSSSFPPAPPSNQFELVFKLLDSNGDGKISSQEMRRLLRRFEYKKLEADEMVKEMDSDGDGFIDMDEFLVAVNRNGGCFDRVINEEEEEEEEVLMEAFKIFDADKNGLISAEEVRRILRKLGCRNCALKDCRRMIEGVDRDGDGFVNFEDFRRMMTAKENNFLVQL